VAVNLLFCRCTMARLVITANGHLGLSHEFGSHWVTIGRAADNNFQLLETSVSGRHCEVRMVGDELEVHDLRSTNGTFIKGRQIAEGRVKMGELFLIGEVELKLEPSAVPVIPVVERVSLPNPTVAAEYDGSLGGKVSVLLVDDSKAFLETASELFDAIGGQSWDIHQAAAADHALAVLQQRQIDLVVLDVVMPMLDGVQLLKIVHQRHPGVKKVILTGNLSESTRAACLANGAELFLEKPTAPDGFRFIFDVLNDLISWTDKEGFTGTLRQVSLADIIQIQCLGARSCILEVCSPSVRGEIYIETGAIVHAVAGTLSGDKAFHQLLSLIGGDFNLQNYREPKERTVRGTWEYLLIEAARVRDEEREEREKADTLHITREPAPNDDEPIDALPVIGEEVVVVSTYDGQWRDPDDK
jgi:CheY-like chemotaxis protein